MPLSLGNRENQGEISTQEGDEYQEDQNDASNTKKEEVVEIPQAIRFASPTETKSEEKKL